MNPSILLYTAALLGFFVLCAGGYGVCHCVAQLSGKRHFLIAAFVSYGLQCVAALGIIAMTPLALEWKLLVAISSVAYLWIPPATWRYLETLHQSAEHS